MNETIAREVVPPARPKTPFSLRLKLTLLAVVVAIVPLAIVGVQLININEEALVKANREMFLAATEEVSETVRSALSKVQNQLDLIAEIVADDSLAIDTRISVAQAAISGTTAVDHLAIYDATGAHVDTLREKGVDLLPFPDNLPPHLVAYAREHNHAEDTAAIVGDGVRVLTIATARGASDTWFVASYASLTPVQRRVELIAADRFGGDLNSLFVVDDKLRVIAHPNKEFADSLTSFEGKGILAGVSPGLFANEKGVTVFRNELDVDGETKTGAVRGIDTPPWGVVVQIDWDVAFGSLVRMRRVVITVVCIAILLALLAAIFLAHRLTKPISELVGFAGDLAERRFTKRVNLKTRDELQVLGAALSTAAFELEESDKKIKEEVAIRSDLGRYLPEQLVDRIVDREQSLELGGERRDITVLFADVANFTPMAEKHSAEEVVNILNQLFTILTEIVFRHGGTVDKFIGDCVMAFWGAPKSQPDHADRALAAAEDMLRFLEVGNENWEKQYGVTIRLAIGINSGEAIVGNFGSETRMEYTAVGDCVNVAARLEAIARPHQILVSEATKDAATNGFEFAPIGGKRLAGRNQPVMLYEVRV